LPLVANAAARAFLTTVRVRRSLLTVASFVALAFAVVHVAVAQQPGHGKARGKPKPAAADADKK